MNIKSRDGILGLALADAMGVPVEFINRQALSIKPVTDMIGYGTYNQPAGTFSDDTSLLLATMDGIIRNGGVINDECYYNIADNFASYFSFGSFTPKQKAFDIGNTTRNAIHAYMNGAEPWLAGGNNEFNKGNGALMRILPLAYFAEQNALSDEETLEYVSKISSITHRLPHCILGSYIYVNFARRLLQGYSKDKAYEDIASHDYSAFDSETLSEYSRILKGKIYEQPENEISSIGKTVDTLEAALWSFMGNDSYESSILQAINLGDDTDTVGCVTGGLSGIYYGLKSIRPSWVNGLLRKDYIESLCDMFDKSINTKMLPSDPKGILNESVLTHDENHKLVLIKDRVLDNYIKEQKAEQKVRKQKKKHKDNSREIDE